MDNNNLNIVTTHGNGRHSESSPDLTASSILDNNHNPLNKTDESISSSSSVEPRSESSLTDPLRSINKDDEILPTTKFDTNFSDDFANDNIEADRESVLSDFISSHMVPLPQITAEPASDEDEEDEDFISVTSSRDATWEDNWLFKKKKSNKTSTSAVGMLVPAPKEDIRALIGDKPTDEISDLSEVGSDTDDSSLEMVSASLEPMNDRLVNKHLIGGKNTKVILDELVDTTSMISTSSLPDNVPPYTETKNEFVLSNDGFNDSEPSKISVNNCNKVIGNEVFNSNVTKSVPSQKPDKPSMKECETAEAEPIVPPPNDFTDDEKMRNLLAKFHEEQNNKTDSGDENSSSLSPRSSISCALSGSIAEREYKKWYNAVDMPNNPYSVEALKHRLSGGIDRVLDLPNISPCIEDKPLLLGQGSTTEEDIKGQERDYARYSRDYYINDAKHASGITKKSPTTPPQIASPTTTASSSSIEVIRNGFEKINSNDWTLSKPVRRSTSLKYPKQFRSSAIPKTLNDDNDHGYVNDDDDMDDDRMSQYSSRSLRAKSSKHQRSSPSSSALTYFEKQLLHKDLKRNSFRAISSTTKDFVLNPIFDQNEFFNKENKLSVPKDNNLSDGDTADSGVDSCLNGIPGGGTRTNLIF